MFVLAAAGATQQVLTKVAKQQQQPPKAMAAATARAALRHSPNVLTLEGSRFSALLLFYFCAGQLQCR